MKSGKLENRNVELKMKTENGFQKYDKFMLSNLFINIELMNK